MLENSQKQEFKKYCLQFYKSLKHPFGGQDSFINISDLEISLDIFESILFAEVKEKIFEGLETQFYSAFGNYLHLARTEIGDLCNNADKLSALIDPFLKKLVFCFFPNKKIKKTGKSIVLYKTSNYADILEFLNIIKVKDIVKKKLSFWEKQPARLAILRKGFTSRQKGVHESRIHNLGDLEKITYSIIGSFVAVCLHLLSLPGIESKIKEIIERRRAIYLLRERVRSYPITNTLFSIKEHLLVYSYRGTFQPNIEEKKFVFLNYLAERGPCFYWLKKDKKLILEWAKKFFKNPPNEKIRGNTIRLLLEKSTPVPFSVILDNFDYFETQIELSEYIKKFATKSDRDLLLKLYNRYFNKREEVALASKEVIVGTFTRVDETLKKLATSSSRKKNILFRSIIKNFAKKKDLEKYRNFKELKDRAMQIIYIYCLGEVGFKNDLELLRKWVNARRRNKNIREACWYSISRIANRFGDSKYVLSLINKRDKTIKVSAAKALTRNGIGKYFKFLFSKNFGNKFSVNSLILEIAEEGDREIIRKHLTKAELDYSTRDLVLALCKIGHSDDFDFLFNLFSKCDYEIRFANQIRVAYNMAKICDKKKIRFLRKVIKSREFWRYIAPGEKRASNPLPVKNTENQNLTRRIISEAFLENAGKEDIPLIFKLLSHYFRWTANQAAFKLAKIGGVKNLDNLIEEAWKLKEKDLEFDYLDRAHPVINTLCLLDKKLYYLN